MSSPSKLSEQKVFTGSQVKKSFKGSMRQGQGNLQQLIENKKSQNEKRREQQRSDYERKAIAQNDQLQTTKVGWTEKYTTMYEVLEDPNEVGGFENGQTTNALFSDYIVIEVAYSCLALMGVLLTVIEFDLEYDERAESEAKILCFVIFISSIVLVVLTYIRFKALLEWKQARKVVGPMETLFSTDLIWQCLGEMVLVLVGPLPWVVHERVTFDSEPAGINGAYYHVNEILGLVLMLRVLLIFRTILMLSYWYNNRSQRVCTLYACEANLLFVIKCIMKTSPYKIVSFGFLSSIFFFGYMIRVCESPLARHGGQNFHSYYNSMWNIIITMTTVGYGDYYPQTHLGRFIIFVVSIWGVFIVSMMVITMTTTLEPTSLENKAIAVLDRLFVREEMRGQAQFVIHLIANIYANQKRTKDLTKELESKTQGKERQAIEKSLKKKQVDYNKLFVQLKKSVGEYKRINRQYRSICDDNISEEMTRQFEFMKEDFKQLYKKQNVLLAANIDIMQALRMSENSVNYYEKVLKNIPVDQDEDEEEQGNPDLVNVYEQDEGDNELKERVKGNEPDVVLQEPNQNQGDKLKQE